MWPLPRLIMNVKPPVLALVALLVTSTALAQSTRPATQPTPNRATPTTPPTTSPASVQRAVVGQGLADLPLPAVTGGPAQGRRSDDLLVTTVFYGPMPTGVTLAGGGSRTFVCFPRWQDPVNYTVARITENGIEPFPDAETNLYLPEQPDQYDPREHFVSVQSVVTDRDGRLWVLDTGSINLGPPIEGGPKLWAYDPNTGERLEAIDFSAGDVIKEKTYLNDVRFDLTRSEAGYAFITDSGEGGIIVVDLATGKAWRKLDEHPSTGPQEVQLKSEGEPFPIQVGADGIAIAPGGQTLYYTPLTGRTIFGVPIASLVDPQADAASEVREVATKESANDGIAVDARGRIYTTDFEDNAIRRINPRTGESELLVQDERIIWPDAVYVADGLVFFTSNQLPRMPQFHEGQDQRELPYVLFAVPNEGAEPFE